MNHVILMGRLTKDPAVTESGKGKDALTIARYTLAVDRNGDETDFISCVCFGKTAEFAESYLSKGTKIAVEGRIQTGKYENKNGDTVYTTDVVVNRHEFCERAKRDEDPEEEKPRNRRR